MRNIWWIVFVLCLVLCGCSKQMHDNSDESGVSVVDDSRSDSESSEEKGEASTESVDDSDINFADLVQKSCGPMMVQLEGGGLLGSGVIAGMDEERIVILTAAHVISQANSYVRVTFFDDYNAVSRETDCYESQDIGVVIVERSDVPEENLEHYQCAGWQQGDDAAVQQGDICIALGCTLGVAAQSYEGIIEEPWIFVEDYGQHMILAKVNGKPGMSGGGLFDKDGNLLGIISGGNDDGELAVIPMSLFAIKVDFLEDLVDNNR
ncbi:MAG: serine protease [Acetatifactor sp.]